MSSLYDSIQQDKRARERQAHQAEIKSERQARKERPVARGVLDYFPDAIAAVATLSYLGNQQHNPGEEMHWAREKSSDHADCVVRHLMQRGKIDDDDGVRHSTKVAWRALANLQLELEAANEAPVSSEPDRPEVEVYQEPQQVSPSPYDPFPESIVEDGTRENVNASASHLSAVSFADLCRSLTFPSFGLVPETALDAEDGMYYTNKAGVASRNLEDVEPQTRGMTHREARASEADLEQRGCGKKAAGEIVAGTTLPTRSTRVEFLPSSDDPRAESVPVVYVAGPMRGYAHYNFPAFDQARDRLAQQGKVVISPADIDRAAGLSEGGDHDDPEDREFGPAQCREFANRDFHALHSLHAENGDAIAMLPGWESSTGAAAEFFLARWLGLTVLDAETGGPLKEFDIGALSTKAVRFLQGQLD